MLWNFNKGLRSAGSPRGVWPSYYSRIVVDTSMPTEIRNETYLQSSLRADALFWASHRSAVAALSRSRRETRQECLECPSEVADYRPLTWCKVCGPRCGEKAEVGTSGGSLTSIRSSWGSPL